jgi:hypothetical protein
LCAEHRGLRTKSAAADASHHEVTNECGKPPLAARRERFPHSPHSWCTMVDPTTEEPTVKRLCERCGRPTGKYEFFRNGEQRHWIHYRCMDKPVEEVTVSTPRMRQPS